MDVCKGCRKLSRVNGKSGPFYKSKRKLNPYLFEEELHLNNKTYYFGNRRLSCNTQIILNLFQLPQVKVLFSNLSVTNVHERSSMNNLASIVWMTEIIDYDFTVSWIGNQYKVKIKHKRRPILHQTTLTTFTHVQYRTNTCWTCMKKSGRIRFPCFSRKENTFF